MIQAALMLGDEMVRELSLAEIEDMDVLPYDGRGPIEPHEEA